MRSDLLRYTLGFLVAVGLIVVVIVVLVRSLVSAPNQTTTPVTPVGLTSYANTATTVQLTIDSPVVAPEKHHDIIINVGNGQSIFTLTQGYQGQVVRTQSYPMDNEAYAVFLRALKANGFDHGNADPSLKDERGQCALGDRYIYQIIDPSGNSIQRFWYTSCGNGTFNGSPSAIRRLFSTQIPDYFKLIQGIQL